MAVPTLINKQKAALMGVQGLFSKPFPSLCRFLSVNILVDDKPHVFETPKCVGNDLIIFAAMSSSALSSTGDICFHHWHNVSMIEMVICKKPGGTILEMKTEMAKNIQNEVIGLFVKRLHFLPELLRERAIRNDMLWILK